MAYGITVGGEIVQETDTLSVKKENKETFCSRFNVKSEFNNWGTTPVWGERG